MVDLFSRWKTDSYGMDGNVKRNGVEYVASPEIKLYCTGGLFNSQSNIFTGAAAERYIESMYADMVFFSSQAISADGEISDVSEEETALRKKMLARAKKKIFLCDSSKIGFQKTFTLCNKDDIDFIICDKPLPRE